MTPNWPHIVATLFVHYPYKTLARASGVDDKHLRKVANSCRDGARMLEHSCPPYGGCACARTPVRTRARTRARGTSA